MPRVVYCEGCYQSHLIRDEFVGCDVRCDCGLSLSISSSAPSVPAPTGLLDLPFIQLGSVGLLFVSVLLLGGVIAWDIGPDAAPTPPKLTTPITAPPSTKKEPDEQQAKKEDKPSGTIIKPVYPKLQELLKQLKAHDLETNDKALKELARLEAPVARQAIPDVVAAAKRNDDKKFRQDAAKVLIELGPPSKKEDYRCLKDALQIPALQIYARRALKELEEKALEPEIMDVLVEALKHRNKEVRQDAFDIMEKLGPNARAPALRLLLDPKGHEDEKASLDVLKELLGEAEPLNAEETDELIKALCDDKRPRQVRCFAVDNLGKGKHAARAVPALLDVLREEKTDVELLKKSIQTLGHIRDKRKEVLSQLQIVAKSAKEVDIRLESLRVLEQLDPSALSIDWIVERCTAEENHRDIRKELVKMLNSRLDKLRPGQIKQLIPLLKQTDREIVLLGLQVVQDRKEEAAEVAKEVAALLGRNDSKVRQAAADALQALGPDATVKVWPHLSELIDRWRMAEDRVVRDALLEILRSRLTRLKTGQMKVELPPLLRDDKDAFIVKILLKVVEERKVADVAADVAALFEHSDATVRKEALNALKAIGPAAEVEQPNLFRKLLAHWPEEKDPDARKALKGLLRSYLLQHKPESMTRRLDQVLVNKEPAIILVGLKVVQDRKKEAAGAAVWVVRLLDNPDVEVRKAALKALQALGTAAGKEWPHLGDLADRWHKEKEAAVRVVLFDTLEKRRDMLEPEKLKDQLPLLLHDEDAGIILLGLEGIRKHKVASAAVVVADLYERNADKEVREKALTTLKTLGPAASKALPKLFEILKRTHKYKCTPLALTAAGIIRPNDYVNVKSLIPFLLHGLHSKSLQTGGRNSEAAINSAICKFGQTAFDGIIEELKVILDDEHPNTIDNANYRKQLYATLVKLGDKCKSETNYETLRNFRSWETRIQGLNNDDLVKAAAAAMKAMDDK